MQPTRPGGTVDGTLSAKISRLLPADALPSALALALLVAVPSLLIGVLAPAAMVTTTLNFLTLLIGVMALAVFTGNSGVMSFGHVGFMAVAAQVSATLTIAPGFKEKFLGLLPLALQQTQWGLWPALIVAVLVVVLIASLIGAPVCRLPLTSLSIATLGLLIIVHSVMIAANGITRGNQAMYGIPKLATVPLVVGLAVAAIVFARLYRDAVPGLLLRAARENEAAARSIGIDVERQRLIAWIASAGLAAIAGVVLAHHLTVYTPRTFYFDLTFSMIVMLVVGGMSSVTGGVVGAIGVTLVIEVVRRFENGFAIGSLQVPTVFGLTQIGLCVIILLTLYRRQQGLFGFDEIEALLPGLRRARAVTAGEAVEPARASAARLQVSGVRKAYGGLVAADDITFALGTGEIVGLIGPNGSGKTTLLGCIAGTHRPTAGSVHLDATDITGWPPHRVARAGLGRTFQTVRLFEQLTVAENVTAAVAVAEPGASRTSLAAASHRLLAELKVAELADRKAGTLAYGQQRRVEIARALALSPAFLLLDEPAAGMNETETAELLGILKGLVASRGIGLLIVDHDMHLIMRLCHRLVVLNKGQVIAEGSPADVQRHPAVLEAYLGRRRSTRGTGEPSIQQVHH